MQMVKVSVIVPVYNAEKYLVQCLDSILAQTLRNIEVICIDDGSTDASGKILDRYAMLDKRLKVLHKENRGYGAAMNAGLDASEGEYIGIVESDDCILPEMYQRLYGEAKTEELDVVKSDAYFWYENIGYQKRIHRTNLECYYDKVLDDNDRNIFFDFYMNIWTGIYKRKFLFQNDIRFHESAGASYQDNGFWLQTMMYCKKAKWLNGAFYLYRQDNENASVKSREKMLAMSQEYEYIEKSLLERNGLQELPYCYYYKLYRHTGNFYRIADENKLAFCEQIQRDYLSYRGYIKGNGYLDDWFRRVIRDPGSFCGQVITKKKKIYEKLNRAGKIIIYGAGNHGDRIFRGLINEGYYKKIACFAMTDGGTGAGIAGKPILQIDLAIKKYPNALVIIAVIKGSNMYKQMERKLEEREINRYIAGSDFEECFYIL